MKQPEKTPEPEATEVETKATPDGRVTYDILSVIRSPEAHKHFTSLDKLAKKGLVPKPR